MAVNSYILVFTLHVYNLRYSLRPFETVFLYICVYVCMHAFLKSFKNNFLCVCSCTMVCVKVRTTWWNACLLQIYMGSRYIECENQLQKVVF